MKIVMVMLSALAIVLFFSRMKWKITLLSLVYYMEQKQYKYPNEEEMKDCTAFVLKNIFKDLTGR